jgi:hypothetical protein
VRGCDIAAVLGKCDVDDDEAANVVDVDEDGGDGACDGLMKLFFLNKRK